jgi:hypothetical protein
MNQDFDDEDDVASSFAEKRQRRSLRFATLSCILEAEGGLSDDENEEDEEDDDEEEDVVDVN